MQSIFDAKTGQRTAASDHAAPTYIVALHRAGNRDALLFALC